MKTNTGAVRLGHMAAAALLCGALGATQTRAAAIAAWGGGDGLWADGEAWAGGVVPNVGADDAAVIHGGYVEYVAGGDFIVNGEVRLAGGAWEQTGGISWMHVGNAKGVSEAMFQNPLRRRGFAAFVHTHGNERGRGNHSAARRHAHLD